MIGITLYDADNEDKSLLSYQAHTVPEEGESFWIDDKRNIMAASLVEYKIVKRSWVLLLLSGNSLEKQSIHCELSVSRGRG